ncbi:MAG TPA: hypothetical protein VNJ08_13015 [Bacteriovoracaceae bacterium]|nr:hypothetical protein [Bacteriovoracaceae bacterium]
MKRIFVALICLSPFAISAAPMVEIKDFNFNYSDPSGKGVAAEFSYGGLKNTGSVTIEVEKILEDFKLKVYGSVAAEYELKKAPDLLTKAQAIDLKAFNLKFKERLNISLAEASFVSPDEELKLTNFNLDCSRDELMTELKDQVINGCISQMSLKSARFSSQSFHESDLISALSSSLTNAVGSGVGIAGLDLKVNAGKYELSAVVKAQISGKAKSHGQVSYDASKKLLTIKITEVKFSVLNVTSKVFDELKKNESEKMKVKQPYVYLTLE